MVICVVFFLVSKQFPVASRCHVWMHNANDIYRVCNIKEITTQDCSPSTVTHHNNTWTEFHLLHWFFAASNPNTAIFNPALPLCLDFNLHLFLICRIYHRSIIPRTKPLSWSDGLISLYTGLHRYTLVRYHILLCWGRRCCLLTGSVFAISQTHTRNGMYRSSSIVARIFRYARRRRTCVPP